MQFNIVVIAHQLKVYFQVSPIPGTQIAPCTEMSINQINNKNVADLTDNTTVISRCKRIEFIT